MKIKNTPLTKNIFILCFVFVLTLVTLKIGAEENLSPGLFSPAGINEQATVLNDTAVLRSRTVRINFDPLCRLETASSAQGMSTDLFPLYLNLFDDVNFTVRIYEIEKTFSGGTSYVGHIEGVPGGEVVMVKTEGILSANINTGEHLYQVKYVADDLHNIKEIRPGSFSSELPPVPVYLGQSEEKQASEKIDAPLDTGNYIDVMVLYTSTARIAEGSATTMKNTIDLAIAESNTGYNNSGVTQRLRLVHTAEVSYNETGFDWDIALSRLQGKYDGYMDDVHTLRNTYGADEVVLVVNANDYCGMGYLMTTLNSSFEAYAFCLVSRDCVTGYYSLAHELGHNMGSHHDRANASSQGVYNYSYGYQAPNEAFRTIMAYDCPGGCTRINYWSNPDKTYGGQPLGVIYTSPLAADNRRSLNNTLSTVRNFRQAQILSASITVVSPNGGEKLTAGTTHNISWSTSGTISNVKIQYSTNNGSSWTNIITSTANDGSYNWTVPSVSSSQCRVKISEATTNVPTDTSNNVFTISTATPAAPKISLNRSKFYFGAIRSGSKTAGQTLRIDNSGGGTLSWSVKSNASWLSSSRTSGSGAGVVILNTNPTSLAAGTYTGAITVSASGASNSPQTVSVTLTVKNSTADQSPFGEFASPTNGSYVSSSIPVTGWALDDIDIASVKIYNGSTYVGDAVFVEGARPDVQAAYANYPKNYQAGWGYMLLTHFLPNGGNGTYILYAKVTDSAGHVVTLGSKTIYCNNYNAVKPFGAIDTPTQGGNASGSNYVNSGWVLTPTPNMIPTNGSTIEVYIDSVKKGTATYNQYRSDIAALFSGYENSNGAAAWFKFNTTGYKNGVHTIFWIVTDNGGNADGVGSRYFIVQNTGADMDGRGEPACSPIFDSHSPAFDSYSPVFDPEASLSPNPDSSAIPRGNKAAVTVTKGFRKDAAPQTVYPDNGMINVVIHELERVVIDFGTSVQPVKSLPIGSTLDSEKGIFYWNPGPGFIGDYELIFAENTGSHSKRVKIKILPKQ